ncbi:MAG: hypothetical protein WGN25_01480 [Candidatus Electrothrix sp. GW3-4]|uniref:hypothetical protein n=1 Tax=Candidatus Electrothrix sp. GW3-4 TaxID=3126740 RepID=UPI0030CF9451
MLERNVKKRHWFRSISRVSVCNKVIIQNDSLIDFSECDRRNGSKCIFQYGDHNRKRAQASLLECQFITEHHNGSILYLLISLYRINTL